MPGFNQGVMATCKHCGKQYPSTEFTLDPVYRMMVCKKCVEERRMKESPIKSGAPAVSRPSSISSVQGSVARPVAKPSPGLGIPSAKPSTAASGNKTRQKCKKCGNVFLYDAEKCYPQNCPQCGTHISTNAQYSFF